MPTASCGSAFLLVSHVDVINEIRSIINLLGSQELSDVVIQNAIDRADTYINALARRSMADPDIVILAKRNYAAFLAYQTYSDRIVNQIPGSWNDEGIWNPTGEVIMREVRNKLNMLKATADASIRQIIAFGPTGRLVRPGWLLY